MRLSTVLASVNNNRSYYLFIPKQILFWKHFNIRFIAVFVGEKIPDELIPYSENIFLWNKNIDLNPVYVAQNIRIYFPALLQIPENEMVMITDMDMLPMNHHYFTDGLEEYTRDDFIYYRNIDGKQIYMCYNAAHPSTWAKVFNIKTEADIDQRLKDNYNSVYDGLPGGNGWFTDQLIMFHCLHKYPYLRVLNRPLKRLEMYLYLEHLNNKETHFISNYDDAHFHRSYHDNEHFILDAEKQLKKKVITFSLWGDKPIYNVGAIINAKDAQLVYPDFECWFYIHEETVPRETVDILISIQNVKIIYKYGDLTTVKPMMWRFEAIDYPEVEIMMSRDTDTRFSQREKVAVEEWLNSDFIFHIMRDHPDHKYTILGGMFGIRKNAEIPSWKTLIQSFIQEETYSYDQDFLREVIYPILSGKSMIHATFYRIEPNCKYFPVEYDTEYHFVGEVVYPDQSINEQHHQHLKCEYEKLKNPTEKKGFIIYLTKDSIPIMNNLLNSILAFSKYDIEIYCINFDSSFNDPRVKVNTINMENVNIFSCKLTASINTLFDYALVLEVDMIVNKNIDDIFKDNEIRIQQYNCPLFAKHPDPDLNINKLFDRCSAITKKTPKMKWVFSNYLFIRKQIWFLEEVLNFATYNNNSVLYHEEEIINALLVKCDVDYDLGYNYFPVGLSSVIDYYLDGKNEEGKKYIDDYNCPVKIYAFHGHEIRDPNKGADFLEKLYSNATL